MERWAFLAKLQKQLNALLASISPYRGLLPFREEDAPFFFGHEVSIQKLLEAVQRQRLVAVVGASGCGKSSVVRAGLVPKLRKDRRTACEIVTLVPTDQPLKALARALVPLLEPALDKIDRLTKSAKLADRLQSGEIALSDIVESILETQPGTDRVLIVVDQFEELYTQTSNEEARRCFLDELLAASARPGSEWFDRRSKDLSDQEQRFISRSRDEKERLAQQEREGAQRLAKALDAAQHALTDSFFRTIGTFPDAGVGVSVRNIPTPDERGAGATRSC